VTPANRPAPNPNRPPTAAAPPRPAPDPRAAERIQRQQERAVARQREERRRRLQAAGLTLLGVLVVGGLLAWAIMYFLQPQPGRTVAIASQTHIAETEKGDDYTSVPPTSGEHYATTATNGVHQEPVPNELQVHNLEHGQIMVQYTCTDCPQLADQLAVFAQRYPKWVLVAPYPNPQVGARIALTAWGRIDTFDEYDEQRITRFIESYKNRGPERVIME
jgi:hypothetical protein